MIFIQMTLALIISLVVHSGPEQFELVEMDVDGKTVSDRSVNEFAQPLSASTQLNSGNNTMLKLQKLQVRMMVRHRYLKAGLAILGAEAVYPLGF